MRKISLAVSLAIGVHGLPLAMSEVQAAELEEIVVTARKRSESLQEVPIAIKAFTAQTIEQAGIERPADFIALMPNVNIVDTANVGDTQVSIRGIVSTRDAESTFAYVVDGVLNTNPNSFNEELVDIEQIEVLKGPQGALYGRNAVAGAILVTTRKPGDEPEGKVTLGLGTQGSSRVAASYSTPLSDSVKASVTYSQRETDGFFSNALTGASSVDFLKDQTGRVRLLWDISDRASLDLKAGMSKVEGGAINFNAAFAIPAFVNIFGSPSFNSNVNDNEFIYSFNVPGENKQETFDFSAKFDYEADYGDWTANVTYNDLDEYLLSDGTSATFYGYELTAGCQADRATLNSFTRTDLFGEAFQPFGVLPPGADFQGVYGPYTATRCDGYQYQERNQKDMSAEVRFSSPQDEALRWSAGAYATSIEREVVVAYGADTGQGFLRQPYVGPTGPNPTDLLFWDEFNTDVFAVFGQLEYDISDTLEFALALRYDREDREVNNRVPNVTASGLNINTLDANFQPGPINPGLANNPGGIPSRSADFDQLQPKVTLNWQPQENINVYTSYGVGFRSGGFNSLGSSDLLSFWFNADPGSGPGQSVDARLQISDEYDKEVSTSLELGFKGEFFDRRLQLNAAIFNTTVDDNQFFEFFAGPFGLLRVVTTIEEIEISGIEADFTYVANDYVSVFGGIGFLDSEIKENRNRPLTVGNEVPQAPEKSFNLGASLEIPHGDNMFFARADWQYVGETWFHTLQGEQTPTIWQFFFGPGLAQDFTNSKRDAYDTLNLRMGYQMENWTFTAWGRNITDERYLEEIIPAPEFGGSFNHQGVGDSYGIEVSYSF
ncbi:MAG: TonB-dependent receptor [Arenicella sp.]|jgi:iron complex outermembrane receptor protein|nr:TonB-dependent receptor [Arenicella sp.]